MKKALVLLILSISLAICLTACDWQLAFGWIIDCDEPIDHTHKFGKWSVTERPTSTKEGLQERICSCGERESKTIAKLPAGKNKLKNLAFFHFIQHRALSLIF